MGLTAASVVTICRHGTRHLRGFYVLRGDVPEKPIGELKNGLQMIGCRSNRFPRQWAEALLEHHVGLALVGCIERRRRATESSQAE